VTNVTVAGATKTKDFGGRFPLGGPGSQIRLGRIANPATGRSVIVTIAHGLFRGPFATEPPRAGYGRLIDEVAAAGADAILTTPGLLPHIVGSFVGPRAPGLILCLDWTNMFRAGEEELGFAEGRQALIATVADAMRLGADGVLTYLFLGFDDAAAEARQVEYNGIVSRACERYGLVRIIETMARGSRLGGNTPTPEFVRMHTRIAAEVGTDLIKSEYTGDAESFRSVVDHCPVPILAAGGPLTPSPRGALEIAAGVIAAGGAGLVFGRNVVQAGDPARVVAALAGIIHRGESVDQAMQALD
jgi:DhnA family fructose-bisphosphate aldolase class Ia